MERRNLLGLLGTLVITLVAMGIVLASDDAAATWRAISFGLLVVAGILVVTALVAKPAPLARAEPWPFVVAATIFLAFAGSALAQGAYTMAATVMLVAVAFAVTAARVSRSRRGIRS